MKRIAKHWRKSNSQLWVNRQKMQSFNDKGHLLKSYLPTFVFVSWLGTYLDLVLINSQLYSFPIRPFPSIFPFNILFTLLVLPIIITLTIHFLKKMSSLHKVLTLLILAFGMTFIEVLSEKIGWFIHSANWYHHYTFVGYILFMWLTLMFHRLTTK